MDDVFDREIKSLRMLTSWMEKLADACGENEPPNEMFTTLSEIFTITGHKLTDYAHMLGASSVIAYESDARKDEVKAAYDAICMAIWGYIDPKLSPDAYEALPKLRKYLGVESEDEYEEFMRINEQVRSTWG